MKMKERYIILTFFLKFGSLLKQVNENERKIYNSDIFFKKYG